MNVNLVAAFASTAADAAKDEEAQRGRGHRSQWRGRTGSEFVAVCIFDADAFGVSRDTVDQAGDKIRFVNRLVEAVSQDGMPVVHRKGRREAIPVAPLQSGGQR